MLACSQAVPSDAKQSRFGTRLFLCSLAGAPDGLLRPKSDRSRREPGSLTAGIGCAVARAVPVLSPESQMCLRNGDADSDSSGTGSNGGISMTQEARAALTRRSRLSEVIGRFETGGIPLLTS